MTDYVNRVNPLLPIARQRYDDAAIAGVWHRAVVHDRGSTIEGRCGETLWPAPGVSGVVLMSEEAVGERDAHALANGGTEQARCAVCFPDRMPGVVAGASFRRFALHRESDVTGISGTGTVAEGVQFGNGRVALQWLTDVTSMAMYDSIQHVERIHGHGGATKVVWLDD